MLDQKPEEILEKRQERSKTFDNKDGTFTVSAVIDPLHYKENYAEDEPWLDIDPNHKVETPEYILYDKMPIKVKVFKNKIGYEVEDRGNNHKITVELDQKEPLGIAFEVKVYPTKVRLWKTLQEGAPSKLRWKITEEGGGKLQFREKPEAFDTNDNNVEVLTTKTSIENGFIWEEEITGKAYEKQTAIQEFQEVEKEEVVVKYPIKVDTDVNKDVAASGDDGEWNFLGSSGFTSSGNYLPVSWNGSDWQRNFMRFDGITISQSENIIKADLLLNSVNVSTSGVVIFYADDSNDPNAPTSYAQAEAITPTSTTVNWSTLSGNQTVDIKTIIQELVNSYDYSNEAMVILAKETQNGNMSLSWHSFDKATTPPRLEITYGVAPLDIDVSDSITITESVTVAVSGPQINVSDSVTVTEDTTIQLSSAGLNINANDSITITESAAVFLPTLTISVSDPVTITESVTFSLKSYISVSDSITITDVPTISKRSYVNVLDSITVTEAITVLLPVLYINVLDSVTVTEAVSMSLGSYIDISDSITITEDTTLQGASYINVSDSITITESVVAFLPTLDINVSDSVTITENVDTNIKTYIIVLADFYSEANWDALKAMYVGDVLAAGQSFTGNGGTLDSVKFYLDKTGSPTGNAYAKIYAHSGTFGDSSVPTGSALATSDAFDISTLTTSLQLITFTFSGAEKITLTSGIHYVVVLDIAGTSTDLTNTVRLGYDSDSLLAHPGNLCTYETSWEAWAIYDACFYVYARTVSELETKVSDSVTVTESVNIHETNNIVVSDSATITEDVSVSLVFVLEINVSDIITTTESTSLVVPLLLIDISDSIVISESDAINIRSYLGVSDSVTITESVSVSFASPIDVSDSITITESVAIVILVPTLFISISDSITITESVGAYLVSYINVSDSVAVSEFADALRDGARNINVSDSVITSESAIVDTTGHPQVNVSDSVAITESITAAVSGPEINVSDSIIVTEIIDIYETSHINVGDSVTITESVDASIKSYIDVFDSVSIAESISLLVILTLSIDTSDGIVVSESTTLLIPTLFVSVGDLITTTESVLYQTQLEGWLYTPEAPPAWTEEGKPVTSWTEESEPSTAWTEE